MVRIDRDDIIYSTERGKIRAVIADIKESYEKGQPVLVGTISVASSEKVYSLMKKEGLNAQLLNAKNDELEASIIALAGQKGAITIATNMAGRGTDIMLGGNSEYLAKQEMRKEQYEERLIEQATAFNETDDKDILEARKKFKTLVEKFNNEIKEEKEKVIEAGGLKIIGTERHESRRIDNQLRGRSGRQGDPGETRFYLSLDDDLLKIFGGDMITRIFERGNVPEDLPIEFGLISKTIETAQSKVEGRNFSIRKHILSYDDVMNIQRDIIYSQRRKVLDGDNIRDNIIDMIEAACEMVVETYSSEIESGKVNKDALLNEIKTNLNIHNVEEINKDKINTNKLLNELKEKAFAIYESKEKEYKDELREVERVVLLKVVDSKWMEHIDNMDELKNGIGLRAYGQKNPVEQYRFEGGDMFDEMVAQIKLEVAKIMLHIVKSEKNVQRQSSANITNASLDSSVMSAMNVEGENSAPKSNQTEKAKPVVNDGPKVGRNDPCPCGSGKKYKQCCGKNQ